MSAPEGKTERPDARKVIQEAIRTARILGYGDVKILARAAEAGLLKFTDEELEAVVAGRDR